MPISFTRHWHQTPHILSRLLTVSTVSQGLTVSTECVYCILSLLRPPELLESRSRYTKTPTSNSPVTVTASLHHDTTGHISKWYRLSFFLLFFPSSVE